MMRPIEPEQHNAQGERVLTCAVHGGVYDDRYEAAIHLRDEHPELTNIAHRILDANRDHLPVSPSIPTFTENQPRNRADRREREQYERRERNRLQRRHPRQRRKKGNR